MDTMVAQKHHPKLLSRFNFQVEDSEKFGLANSITEFSHGIPIS